ncbi:hypothetical protein EBZ39_10835 [bacterium]|nr:hypothetical protein [bacterium]
MSAIDFKAINASLLLDGHSILKQWFPLGKKNGNEFKIGDIKGAKGDSLSINLKTGLWKDFASGESGGDLISLYAAFRGIDQKQSAAQLAAMVGRDVPSIYEKKDKAKEDYKDIFEIVPDGAPQPPQSYKGVAAAKTWCYRNHRGEVLGYVIRFNTQDGKKEFLPYRWINGQWVSKHFPKPRILYRIDELAQRKDAMVIVSEGEKTSDALKTYYPECVSVTWPGGSNAWQYADWSILAGRNKVAIFPDADEAGVKSAMGVAETLIAMGVPNVRILDIRDRPAKWDAADDIDAGIGILQFQEWVKPRMLTHEQAKEIYSNITTPKGKIQDRGSPERVNLTPFDHPVKELPTDPNPLMDGIDVVNNDMFRCLGYLEGYYYFYNYRRAEVVKLGATNLINKGHLMHIAPLEYWTGPERFNGKFDMAANALMRACEFKGVFDSGLIRGMGAWEDRGRYILNIGDKLLVDGQMVDFSSFETEYIYEKRQSSRNFPYSTHVLTSVEASKLVNICMRARWADPISPYLLAGWVFSSIICGAMPWRTHIYIFGPAGSGKSWVIENILQRLLKGFCYEAQSKATESGIRQQLKGDARPVILDETEAEEEKDRLRLQGIFDLARQASTGNAPIVKGSISGEAIEYYVRSSFAFASITPSQVHEADQTRTEMMRLLPPPDATSDKAKDDSKKFIELQQSVIDTFTDEYRARLFTRAIKMLKVCQRAHKLFAREALPFFGSPRKSDMRAFMLAGLWCLQYDDEPDQQSAKEFLSKLPFGTNETEQVQKTDNRLISIITQTQYEYVEGHNRQKRNIGYLIQSARTDTQCTEYRVLCELGIRVDGDSTFISNDSVNLKNSVLRNTPFVSNWDKVLLSLPGAAREKRIYFSQGFRGGAVKVPTSVLLNEVDF